MSHGRRKNQKGLGGAERGRGDISESLKVSPENGVAGRDECVAGQPHLMERLGQGLWWGGLEAASRGLGLGKKAGENPVPKSRG